MGALARFRVGRGPVLDVATAAAVEAPKRAPRLRAVGTRSKPGKSNPDNTITIEAPDLEDTATIESAVTIPEAKPSDRATKKAAAEAREATKKAEAEAKRIERQVQLLAEIASDLKKVCPSYDEFASKIRRFASRQLSSEDMSVLGVVSAKAGEGRTTVALSLASALAEIYPRVVFVEASRGESLSLAEQLRVEPEVHLDAYLEGNLSALETLHGTAKEGLWVLLAGMADSGSLRMIAAMRSLLRDLREQFDVVVVDLPPLLVSEDAPAVASELDAIVVVVEAGGTSSRDLDKALGVFASTPIKGVILNKTSYKTPRWVASLISAEDRSGIL
jgi:Mrp family chromosome partitioning ATPase